MFTRLTRFGFCLILAITLAACNMPSSTTPTPALDAAATMVAATISAIQTSTALAPTASMPATTDTPTLTLTTPAETATFTPFPTPQNPLVVKDALCWMGPGPAYEVVSSVKKDTRVELLGRGSTGAWWIISNPIYHDPCWLAADVLQLDAGFNLTNLKVFTPPPTPTATATSTATPTPIVISP
jgi:hypothetical protein